jgi:hypothetical protein
MNRERKESVTTPLIVAALAGNFGVITFAVLELWRGIENCGDLCVGKSAAALALAWAISNVIAIHLAFREGVWRGVEL